MTYDGGGEEDGKGEFLEGVDFFFSSSSFFFERVGVYPLQPSVCEARKSLSL